MTTNDRLVQAELMLPHEIESALAIGSIVYLPLGTIEYHSRHLPVGLDGLTAHGICTRAARRTGGIVLPTLFYGTGGGHASYPWTIMMRSESDLSVLLHQALIRLADFGVRTAVIFTGHFADEQVAMINRISAEWNESASSLRVLALSVNQAPASVEPDHAGIFETSLLYAIRPDRIQLDRLPSIESAPAEDPDGDVQGIHRHRPEHPLYGIFGPDPREFDPSAAEGLLEELVGWTRAQVQTASTASSG